MKTPIAPRDSWITISPGQSIHIDKKLAKDWQLQVKALREIRGNVIAISIEIEIILDQLIQNLFYPKGYITGDEEKIKKIFDHFILKERPMTFNSKISLFRRLTKEHYLLLGKDLKDLADNMDRIREIINRFAHNTLAFFPEGDVTNQKLVPKLTCYDKEILLNDVYFNELNKLYINTHQELENLIRSVS
ncbi:MAG: hypothetical protein HY831_00235 [Candidatus Aenigmarchaeota archaeon]|nr:hypothetical protein [Candidatus Aenigmarchaeota archaeon]